MAKKKLDKWDFILWGSSATFIFLLWFLYTLSETPIVQVLRILVTLLLGILLLGIVGKSVRKIIKKALGR